jgi:hypothetical protein
MPRCSSPRAPVASCGAWTTGEWWRSWTRGWRPRGTRRS